MRAKLSTLFGFLFPAEESYIGYLNRMDKIGNLGQFQIVKLLSIICEEIEKNELDIKELKASLDNLAYRVDGLATPKENKPATK